MPTTDNGTAATQAITLTGVRADLLQIAQAERVYIATNGQCASLDELISSSSLSITRTERDDRLTLCQHGHCLTSRANREASS